MIKDAIKTKIVKSIEKGKIFQNFIWRIDKRIICAGIFGLVFIGKDTTIQFVHQYRIYFGGAICVNLFAFFDQIVSIFISIGKFIGKIEIIQPQEKELKDPIDNVEKSDLISFLLKNKGFPFMNAKMQFGINPKEYKKIGDNLERIGVLIRGENNARILKENITREILENIFNCSNSDDLFAPLLRNGNSFTVQKL